MKRWTMGLLAVSLLASSSAAEAALPWRKHAKHAQYPPRYERGSMSQTVAIKQRDGSVKFREAYPGYESKFPPPAYLYYGYPHSGDDTGPGLERWP